MKFKIQGPSLARAPCKSVGGAVNKYSLSYLILYLEFCILFLKEGSKNRIKTPQNLDQPLLLLLHHDIAAGNNSLNLSRTGTFLVLVINILKGKVNGEVQPRTSHEGPEGE